MIALIGDIKESITDGIKEATIPILFMVETRPETPNPTRYDTTFVKLYDLLDAFNKELGKSPYVNMTYPDFTKLDSAYYSGLTNKISVYTDVLVCEYKIEILDETECDYEEPTTFDLVVSAGTGGTTIEAPGTYTANKDDIKAFYAEPSSGYRFLKWLQDGGQQLSNPIAIVFKNTGTLIANFIKQWYLTTSVVGAGTITPSSGLLDEGNITIEVTVTNPLVDEFEKIEVTPDGEATQTFFTSTLVWFTDKATMIVGYVKAIFITIQDIFSTPIQQSGLNYIYPALIGNDVIVKGSNYAYFDNLQSAVAKFETITIANGDRIKFWAKKGTQTTEAGVLYGTPNGRHIKINSSSQITVNIGSLRVFNTGVTTTNWNYYEVFIDNANLRVGLSVNGGSFSYQAISAITATDYLNILANNGALSEISLYNIEWKDINGNYKLHLPLCEGYGLPYLKNSSKKIMRYFHAKYLFQSSLPPFNEINNFRKQPAKRRLIYLFGQSNMTGQTFTGVSDEYKESQSHYYAFSSLTYNQLNLGGLRILDEYSSTASIEMSSGVSLNTNGDDFIFIKVAYPGSDLHLGWQKGGYQYTTQAAALIPQLKTKMQYNGIEFVETEIWWLQGETFTGNVSNSDGYYNDFVQMITDMVSDGILGSELPVRIGLLSNTPYAHEAVVNEAYGRIVTRYGGALIATSDIPKNGDNVHYPAESLITLGQRFAISYISSNYPVLSTSKKVYIPSYDSNNACNGMVLTNIDGFGSESLIDGLLVTGLETDANFDEIHALENSDTIEITKDTNTVSRLKIKQ